MPEVIESNTIAAELGRAASPLAWIALSGGLTAVELLAEATAFE